MKFMYIGDEPETTIFGVTFPQGEAVEVTDPRAIAKLKHNHLFVANEDEAKPEPKAKKAKKAEQADAEE